MERINVPIDDRLKQELEAEARAKGVTPSALVRQLLEEHYPRAKPPEDCYQLARRLGILGSIEGLPADLSTNPDHMEGLGVPERTLIDGDWRKMVR